MVFYNFFILRQESVIKQIQDIVLDLICDEHVEVRLETFRLETFRLETSYQCRTFLYLFEIKMNFNLFNFQIIYFFHFK